MRYNSTMSLSEPVQHRLDQMRAMQLAYHPSQAIESELSQKNLAMVVAPTACGKSYLMQQVIACDSSCKRVVDITTRPPRADDPAGAFQYLPHDDRNVTTLLDRIAHQDLVQYAIHPTTDYFYGSDIAGYPGEYNFLEVLSSTVALMRRLPFRRTTVIGVAVEVAQWQQWFEARYGTSGDDRRKRLQEAIMSLSWLTDATHGSLVKWVQNGPSHDPAIEAIAIVKDGSDGASCNDLALAMLDWAKSELVRSA